MIRNLLFFLLGVFLVNPVSASLFSDVSSSDWYYQDVSNMSEWGVIKGNQDGTFKPGSFVNRAELAAMWNRYDERVMNTIQEGVANSGSVEGSLEEQALRAELKAISSFLMRVSTDFLMYQQATNKQFSEISEVFDALIKAQSKSSTPYYIPTYSPYIPPAPSCESIRESYAASGFGRSSAMDQALENAGCN